METKEIKKHLDEQAKLLKDYRKEVEKKNSDTAEQKIKLEKMEKDLNKHQDKNAKIVKKIEKKKEEEIEMKDRVQLLEKQLFRHPGGKSSDESKILQVKEMKHFLNTGSKSIKGIEYKYLRTDNDVEGGYLVPQAPLGEIIKKITEVSDMRSICTVRSTVNKSVPWPVRVTLVKAEWVGEAEEDELDNSEYGKEEIPTRGLAVTVPITVEEIQDAAFNMETEILSDVGESMAQKEGAGFITGSGPKQPEGFLTNSDIQIVTSGTSATFGGDDLIDLQAELKTAYRNPLTILSRRSLAHVRKLKSSTGEYLLVPGISGGLIDGLPNTINGFRYKEMPDMPEIGSNSKSVAFGDFRRGYYVIDRIGMTMIRDVVTQKRKRMVELTFSKRVGGQTILAEAIKILQNAA